MDFGPTLEQKQVAGMQGLRIAALHIRQIAEETGHKGPVIDVSASDFTTLAGHHAEHALRGEQCQCPQITAHS